jgi:hypothetical protein
MLWSKSRDGKLVCETSDYQHCKISRLCHGRITKNQIIVGQTYDEFGSQGYSHCLKGYSKN